MKLKFVFVALMATSALVWGRDPIPMNLKAPVRGRVVVPQSGPPHPALGVPIVIHPGPVVKSQLVCDAPRNKHGVMVGVNYSMSCESQNLAPGKSKISCELFRNPVRANAKKTKIPLVVNKMKKETAKTAFFVSEEIGTNIKVEVNKYPVHAEVKFGDTGTHFLCTSVHIQ